MGFLNRLKEPSSAAGLAAVISNAAGLAAGQPASVAVPAILAGLFAVLMPERANG
ncbi:hypothetical protein DLM_1773 [Aquitalea magnusonii]|uniref:Uncharacterized protein n=1 Tax=Aquitalea magnusonii TaxID=332411 RepID=A0A3G9GFG6_9NEIS|nr:hypothetical protein DLM_1773 [Aquitalea magnusonii]